MPIQPLIQSVEFSVNKYIIYQKYQMNYFLIE